MRFAASEEAAWAALGIAMLAAIVAHLWLMRGTTLWEDELALFGGSKGFDPRYLLAAHNGQLILVPRLIYSTVFALFGPDYLALRLVHLAGILMVAGLLFALLWRRVPSMVAVAPAALFLFLGSAWTVLMPATGIINIYCLVGGLGAMLALDRGGRWADPLAALLLAISLACWSAGLAFAAGAAILLLRSPAWRRRAWVVAVPVVLYVLWLGIKPGLTGPLYGGSLSFKASNILLIPNFTASAFGSALAAGTGLDFNFGSAPASATPPATPPADFSWAPALALVALGGMVLASRRIRVADWPWPWITVLLTFWVLTSVDFLPVARAPNSDRYLAFAVPVLALIACELAGRWPGLARRRAAVALLAVAAAAFALGANVKLMADAGTFLRGYSSLARADLAAVQLAGEHGSPGPLTPANAATSPLGALSAPTYLAAAARIGTLGESLPELRSAPEAARESADQVLTAADGLNLAPASRPPAPTCRRVGTGQPFRLPRGGAVLRSPRGGGITIRRFGSAFTASAGSLRPRGYEALAIPRDSAPDPWFGQSSAPSPLTVCRLPVGNGH